MFLFPFRFFRRSRQADQLDEVLSKPPGQREERLLRRVLRSQGCRQKTGT